MNYNTFPRCNGWRKMWNSWQWRREPFGPRRRRLARHFSERISRPLQTIRKRKKFSYSFEDVVRTMGQSFIPFHVKYCPSPCQIRVPRKLNRLFFPPLHLPACKWDNNSEHVATKPAVGEHHAGQPGQRAAATAGTERANDHIPGFSQAKPGGRIWDDQRKDGLAWPGG